MNTPLLLLATPMDDINKEKEEEKWEKIVKAKGYHEQ